MLLRPHLSPSWTLHRHTRSLKREHRPTSIACGLHVVHWRHTACPSFLTADTSQYELWGQFSQPLGRPRGGPEFALWAKIDVLQPSTVNARNSYQRNTKVSHSDSGSMQRKCLREKPSPTCLIFLPLRVAFILFVVDGLEWEKPGHTRPRPWRLRGAAPGPDVHWRWLTAVALDK